METEEGSESPAAGVPVESDVMDRLSKERITRALRVGRLAAQRSRSGARQLIWRCFSKRDDTTRFE